MFIFFNVMGKEIAIGFTLLRISSVQEFFQEVSALSPPKKFG